MRDGAFRKIRDDLLDAIRVNPRRAVLDHAQFDYGLRVGRAHPAPRRR
jgi:hypothetical protein